MLATLSHDCDIKHTCSSSENCLRTPILSAIGEPTDRRLRTVSASTCCIVCSGGRIPVQRLDVMKVGKAKSNKRKRPKVREINSALEDNISMQ